MKIEEGRWQKGWIGCRPRDFHTRIVIGFEEFERLELGRFERRDVNTPCHSWCSQNIEGLHDWITEHVSSWENPPAEHNIIYFAHPQDALAFYLRWS